MSALLSLTSRPASGEEFENERLKALLGEMLLERKLPEAAIVALEAGCLLAWWRSGR